MSDERRLELSPDVQAFHEQTRAALAALETASSPEEVVAARARLLGLRDEAAALIRANHVAMRGLLEDVR